MCSRVYSVLGPWKIGNVGHTAVIEWLKTFYHNIVVNFRSELRKNFLTPKAVSAPGGCLEEGRFVSTLYVTKGSFKRLAWHSLQAFNHFDNDNDGFLVKTEVARALEMLKIDIKYFEYVWLTLDIDNSGTIEYWEFVENMTSNMDEILKVSFIAACFVPRDIVRETTVSHTVLNFNCADTSFLFVRTRILLLAHTCRKKSLPFLLGSYARIPSTRKWPGSHPSE
jgi:hypothetical protein